MSTDLSESFDSRAVASSPVESSQLPCTWPGHCLGATCNTNDDCDNDWICENRLCSPCCGTPNPTSNPTDPPAKGIKPGVAVGIGVSIPIVLCILVSVGFYLLRRRRRKEIGIPPHGLREKDIKVPARGAECVRQDSRATVQNHSQVELMSPSVPSELWSTELAELDGGFESSRQTFGSPHKLVPEVAIDLPGNQRSPRGYVFEEYIISPNTDFQGELSFSPVSAT